MKAEWHPGMPYQGVNPMIWDWLTPEQRERALRACLDAYRAMFKFRPCNCEYKPGCPCPCHNPPIR